MITQQLQYGMKCVLTAYHADVVGAVSDRERDGVLPSLDELDDKCFLQWSHPTTDDNLTPTRHVNQ